MKGCAGRRIVKVGDAVKSEDFAVPSGPRCAAVSDFSLHPNVCIPARDRMRLERLFRYAGRRRSQPSGCHFSVTAGCCIASSVAGATEPLTSSF